MSGSHPPPACGVVVEGEKREAPVPELVRVVDLAGLDQPQHRLDHGVPAPLRKLPQLLDHTALNKAHQAGQNQPGNGL